MRIVDQLIHLAKAGGRPAAARLSRWEELAESIVDRSEDLRRLTDQQIQTRALELRWQAKSGISLEELLPEVYALVREASRRVLRQEHYVVQLIGGICLFEGGLAEMQTGEGKTLTATLPTVLRAFPGRGCHIVTVNDYLADRDAGLLRPVYKMLGLTVGVVLSSTEPGDRREQYARDITYATSRELGFDFLRDRLKAGARTDEPVRQPLFSREGQDQSNLTQRGHYFALVDEADSVLLDDARTPLVIGAGEPVTPEGEALLRWCGQVADRLQPLVDYTFDPARRHCELTDMGVRHVILAGKPPEIGSFDSEKIYHRVEQALEARVAFRRDRDYVVNSDDVISIVDEGTGRVLEGRKWQAGLHQAIEVKEAVPITDETGELARITVQSFFRRYEHLAGMTGTALPAAAEFYKVHRLQVTAVPTHRPCQREQLTTRIFATQGAKRAALLPEIERLHQAGRAILIGTPSVEASQALGALLKEYQLPYVVLNALLHAQEADIVAEAGAPGSITIATNMAGRGTDIPLDPKVRDVGGLHVIATEMHSSRRIDRQLIGRCARQGDPGSFQVWLSLEDELFRSIKREELARLQQAADPDEDGELSLEWLGTFERIQRDIERRELKHRKDELRREKDRETLCRSTGLDPYLELAE